MTTRLARIHWLSQQEGGRHSPPTGPRYSAPARFEADAEKWPDAAWSLVIASVAAAVILALPRGKVPFTRGDCPPYHECFTIGRPYLDVAVLVALLGIVAARYLWPTQPATQALHRVRI